MGSSDQQSSVANSWQRSAMDNCVSRIQPWVLRSKNQRNLSARYGGSVPCKHLNVRTASLNWILSGAHSRWLVIKKRCIVDKACTGNSRDSTDVCYIRKCLTVVSALSVRWDRLFCIYSNVLVLLLSSMYYICHPCVLWAVLRESVPD